jgi:hypothetical protein
MYDLMVKTLLSFYYHAREEGEAISVRSYGSELWGGVWHILMHQLI